MPSGDAVPAGVAGVGVPAMSVLRWLCRAGVDVVGVGVGEADVGEAEVGDGEAEERGLGDADGADWDVARMRRPMRTPAEMCPGSMTLLRSPGRTRSGRQRRGGGRGAGHAGGAASACRGCRR